jgi:hypothetical protein
MLRDLEIAAAGLLAWTLLEYVIHGTLAHAHRTFVTPMHYVHHHDPSRVFALRAWPWVAIVWFGGLAWRGLSPAMIFLSGLLMGFALYEFMHYRYHFAKPSSAVEARLRARHLAHHVRAANYWFGVTTPLWDQLLGSEPPAPQRAELEAAGARVAPMLCRSNLERVERFIGLA